MIYQRTEPGTWMLLILGVAAVIAYVALAPLSSWGAAGTSVLLALIGYAFSAFTIEVDAREIRWYFRLGVPAGRLPLTQLARVEPTATTFLDGIGIHRTLRGWVWNDRLGDAVCLHRTEGAPIVLGTSDPSGLCAAIAQATHART